MRSALRHRPLLCFAILLSLPLTGCDSGCRRPSLHTKEAVLRTNLHTLRDVIGQYRQDKGRRPEELEELVEAGYLRMIPIDPITLSRESWVPVYAPGEGGVRMRGITAVRSGAEGRGTDGRLYQDW